jgi:hypothetical protein
MVILVLVAAPLQVMAQDGPLARSISREVARIQPDQQENNANTDWNRVPKLTPGTEITLAIQGAKPGNGYFLSADDSSITMLNLTESTLAANVKRVLRNIASAHPEYLLGTVTGTFTDGTVNVGPDGAVMAGQKVADLRQVVERVERDKIVEIKAKGFDRHSWIKRLPAKFGALIGFGVGFTFGTARFQGPCQLECGYNVVGMFGSAGLGTGLGAGLGALIGAAPSGFSDGGVGLQRTIRNHIVVSYIVSEIRIRSNPWKQLVQPPIERIARSRRQVVHCDTARTIVGAIRPCAFARTCRRLRYDAQSAQPSSPSPSLRVGAAQARRLHLL